ncbi:KH domain-containing protein At4g18375-like isoform X4 [Diospyros lotus]|uniref:KH domain-containing protein At4g18375-like isoform X4 n=1 Tax=Diospyros lotus TaxID=55363 RepID=UPI002254CE12|nr:KH domain-containing protein At4g18375-like isoform X4 [Diospyros lotus]
MPPVLSIPLLSYEERTENGNGLHMLYSSSLDSYGSLSMGDTDYGSLSSYSSKLLPPPSTLEMIVPAHAVGKVMGKGGANIDNICKVDWQLKLLLYGSSWIYDAGLLPNWTFRLEK